MSVKEMSQVIGNQITVQFEQVQVHCMIEDVKVAYGKPRLLIRPMDGTGTQWIETARVLAFASPQTSELLQMGGIR